MKVESTTVPEKFSPFSALPNVAELRAHDIANEDPLMSVAEFEALKVSIKASGIREPITLFRDQDREWILDGRNRCAAAKEVGHRFVSADFRLFNGSVVEARKLAGELNDIRRHLGMDQRREKAARKIRENPTLSSRAIASMCGVSHTLIAEMRKEAADERSKEQRVFDKFADAWIKLPLVAQEKFVKEYRTDLSELLRGAA